MALQTPADYIVVPGKVDICIALPNAYSTLYKLGESEDGIQVEKRAILLDVPGDRHGGNSGPPIERQLLGLEASFQLRMSRWDADQIAKLEKFGGLLTTAGTLPLATVGALLHRDRGIRVLLYCTRDSTQSINFPCCVWTQPIVVGKSTKYSTLQIGMTAARAPEGYWNSDAAGIVYDSNVTGYP